MATLNSVSCRRFRRLEARLVGLNDAFGYQRKKDRVSRGAGQEADAERFMRGFTVLESFSENSQGECLRMGECLLARRSVCGHAWQIRHHPK